MKKLKNWWDTHELFWQIGKGRFEICVSVKGEWGIPFGFNVGVGAYSFRFLCVNFEIWRGTMRYTNYKKDDSWD